MARARVVVVKDVALAIAARAGRRKGAVAKAAVPRGVVLADQAALDVVRADRKAPVQASGQWGRRQCRLSYSRSSTPTRTIN